MTIRLTETQYRALLKALDELEDIELSEGCNDVFRGDKIYALSISERKAAKKLDEGEDGEKCLWNFSATRYLIHILKKQGA